MAVFGIVPAELQIEEPAFCIVQIAAWERAAPQAEQNLALSDTKFPHNEQLRCMRAPPSGIEVRRLR